MFYLLIALILVHVSFIPLLSVVDVIIDYFIGLLHRFKGVFAFQWVKLKTAFKASVFQTMFLMDLTLRNKNKINIQTKYSHRESQECLKKVCFIICRFKVLLKMSEEENFKVPYGFH